MSEVASAVRAPASRGPAGELRAWIQQRREELKPAYFKRPDPHANLAANAAAVDEMLGRLWRETVDSPRAALVAVGGYGRGALFPHSDVDVLVLLPDGATPDASVETSIHQLWDGGSEPGHP